MHFGEITLANTLAYFNTELITAIKSFRVLEYMPSIANRSLMLETSADEMATV
jgi:hypothetical protein